MLTSSERREVVLLMALAVAAAFIEAIGIGAVFAFIKLLAAPTDISAIPVLRSYSGIIEGINPDRIAIAGAIILMLMFIARNIFLAIVYYRQARFTSDIEVRLGTDLVRAFLEAPYTQRLDINSSDKIRVITGEVGRVCAGFTLPAIQLITEGFVICTIIVLLFAVNPLIAAFALLVAVVLAVGMHAMFRPRLARYRDIRVVALAGAFRWANESIGALKETKVLGREQYFIDQFSRDSRNYGSATQAFTVMNQLPRLIIELTVIAALLTAVIVTVYANQPLSDILPVLTVFGLAAVRVMPSATRIIASVNNLKYYAPAVHEVSGNLALAERLTRVHAASRAHQKTSDEPFCSLRLADVSFTYPGASRPSLNAINLSICKGELVAIIGPSGSGKTTLTDMLLGLLEPDSGVLRANGRIVASLRHQWRGAPGFVPQDFFLRDDSVRRNVAFGIADRYIDDKRVWQAIRLAQMEERVKAMRDGLDTVIGERGAALSGGERQRLSIARALYDEPDILVLDEATSALDGETEREIMDTLRDLAGDKTVVLVTHRAAVATRCDRVLTMDRGDLVVTAGQQDNPRDHSSAYNCCQSEAGNEGRSGDRRG